MLAICQPLKVTHQVEVVREAQIPGTHPPQLPYPALVNDLMALQQQSVLQYTLTEREVG